MYENRMVRLGLSSGEQWKLRHLFKLIIIFVNQDARDWKVPFPSEERQHTF